MILSEIFRQVYSEEKPKRALDLCAAPGGKSTLLQSLLDENSVLIANETIKPRAQILKENHIRLGISENLIITQNDPKDFSKLEEFFDYIQIDAPCSGEGMFRRDEIAIHEWSEANCNLCSERSKRILADAIPALSKDGILVYSTCTFNPDENEKIIDWACEEFDLKSVPLNFDSNWGIKEVKLNGFFGYYFYPHKVWGEGLFVSVMKKKSGFGLAEFQSKKNQKSIQIPELVENENNILENGNLIRETEMLRNVKNEIKSQLNIVYSGIELGELKGKNFVPAQALANFHKELHRFPKIEVDEKTALEFLRGNDPNLDLYEKGIYLLTYKNLGLGFVKFIGNRSNNYYPKPWRIKNY
jgi:NOL1/NOP2/fmu family ribosome biogenesis protein